MSAKFDGKKDRLSLRKGAGGTPGKTTKLSPSADTNRGLDCDRTGTPDVQGDWSRNTSENEDQQRQHGTWSKQHTTVATSNMSTPKPPWKPTVRTSSQTAQRDVQPPHRATHPVKSTPVEDSQTDIIHETPIKKVENSQPIIKSPKQTPLLPIDECVKQTQLPGLERVLRAPETDDVNREMAGLMEQWNAVADHVADNGFGSHGDDQKDLILLLATQEAVLRRTAQSLQDLRTRISCLQMVQNEDPNPVCSSPLQGDRSPVLNGNSGEKIHQEPHHDPTKEKKKPSSSEKTIRNPGALPPSTPFFASNGTPANKGTGAKNGVKTTPTATKESLLIRELFSDSSEAEEENGFSEPPPVKRARTDAPLRFGQSEIGVKPTKNVGVVTSRFEHVEEIYIEKEMDVGQAYTKATHQQQQTPRSDRVSGNGQPAERDSFKAPHPLAGLHSRPAAQQTRQQPQQAEKEDVEPELALFGDDYDDDIGFYSDNDLGVDMDDPIISPGVNGGQDGENVDEDQPWGGFDLEDVEEVTDGQVLWDSSQMASPPPDDHIQSRDFPPPQNPWHSANAPEPRPPPATGQTPTANRGPASAYPTPARTPFNSGAQSYTTAPASGQGGAVDPINAQWRRTDFHFSKEVRKALVWVFKLQEFRPNQLEVVNAALTGKDTFVLMPTGGGKSLCYQLPAVVTPGVTFVVSPLLSLIHDQVQALVKLDVGATHLPADPDHFNKVIMDLRRPGTSIKVVYLTPEKMYNSSKTRQVMEFLYRMGRLDRIVIDEAHCVSSWGHDFRPDYQKLGQLRQHFPKVPFMALTATATPRVVSDVRQQLGMADAVIFRQSFNRPNLDYAIMPKKNGAKTLEDMVGMIKSRWAGQCGIIYCFSRKECQKVAEFLRKNRIKANHYHAGMTEAQRCTVQRLWQEGKKIHVICATIAFGMGIDKPNVRFVLHYSLPKSIEGYYQETGRAGRDGNKSTCVLFYHFGDRAKIEFLVRREHSGNSAQLQCNLNNVACMVAYCENESGCRRAQLLEYFDEPFQPGSCQRTCDNCRSGVPLMEKDYTHVATQILACVEQLNGEETLMGVVEVIRGSQSKRVLDKCHNEKPGYGCAKDIPKSDCEKLLRKMVVDGVLGEKCISGRHKQILAYLVTGPRARDLKAGRKRIFLRTRSQHDPQNPVVQEPPQPQYQPQPRDDYDPAFYDAHLYDQIPAEESESEEEEDEEEMVPATADTAPRKRKRVAKRKGTKGRNKQPAKRQKSSSQTTQAKKWTEMGGGAKPKAAKGKTTKPKPSPMANISHYFSGAGATTGHRVVNSVPTNRRQFAEHAATIPRKVQMSTSGLRMMP